MQPRNPSKCHIVTHFDVQRGVYSKVPANLNGPIVGWSLSGCISLWWVTKWLAFQSIIPTGNCDFWVLCPHADSGNVGLSWHKELLFLEPSSLHSTSNNAKWVQTFQSRIGGPTLRLRQGQMQTKWVSARCLRSRNFGQGPIADGRWQNSKVELPGTSRSLSWPIAGTYKHWGACAQSHDWTRIVTAPLCFRWCFFDHRQYFPSWSNDRDKPLEGPLPFIHELSYQWKTQHWQSLSHI